MRSDLALLPSDKYQEWHFYNYSIVACQWLILSTPNFHTFCNDLLPLNSSLHLSALGLFYKGWHSDNGIRWAQQWVGGWMD